MNMSNGVRSPLFRNSALLISGIIFSYASYRILLNIVYPSALAVAGLGPLVLYVVMLLGMVFNIVHEEAAAAIRRSRRFGWKEIKNQLSSNPRLWMALTVSPMVYYGTYLATVQIPSGVTALFFAFQNGFFWQSVATGFRRRHKGEAGAT